jgi:hypothetical protein
MGGGLLSGKELSWEPSDHSSLDSWGSKSRADDGAWTEHHTISSDYSFEGFRMEFIPDYKCGLLLKRESGLLF